MDEYICQFIDGSGGKFYYKGFDDDEGKLKLTKYKYYAYRFAWDYAVEIVRAVMDDDICELRIIRVKPREDE